MRERPEDIEPNLDYELEKYARASGRRATFNKEGRAKYRNFAISAEAKWSANFRDLNASVIRMATLARTGRITVEGVDQEIKRLQAKWSVTESALDSKFGIDLLKSILSEDQLKKIDPFDQVQLEYVIRTCRDCRTLSEAGRALFSASRQKRSQANDADRLRKYLLRFDLDWERIVT